ncbi:MAG: FtsX-like permease family protein [Streptosporangiaceae bacterium]
MRTLSRLRAAWVTLTGTGAAASIAFALLVFASVLASVAIPRESVGLRNGALQRVITASHSSDWAVTATAVFIDPISNEPLEVTAPDLAGANASFRSQLSAAGVPMASGPPAWSGLTSTEIQFTGAAPAAGYAPPRFEMVYRTALARYSHVVAGHLPTPGGGSATGVVQAAVTASTAARFGLRVGTRLHAGPVQMVVTGIIQPVLPAAVFWTADATAARPQLTPATSSEQAFWTGALFIAAGALPVVQPTLDPVMGATWWYPVALGRLTVGQAGRVEAGLQSLVSSGAGVRGEPVTATITSSIPSILSPFIAGESAVAPVLQLLYVSLAVMGAVVVLLGAQLVAQRRAAEFTLMRARGAALYQLAWVALRASLVIAAAAGAAGAALAIGLTPRDGDAVAWWLAGVTIAVTLVGPAAVSVVPQRVASRPSGRDQGAARRTARRNSAARRIVIEAGLAALAIGGLVVLRNQGLGSGNSGVYPSAAPVLVAIPVAIVVLRCYPPLARQLARIAGLSRGVVAFVGLARATRTPSGTALPSFALVLVLAMVAFPEMISTSVSGSHPPPSPWLNAAQTALTQGAAIAAGFGVLVLLLSLLLTARTREMTLARMATMGLRRWQANLLLAAEALPPVVAAAIGGVVCAWLLAPLVGPSLNLGTFSGTGLAIAVNPAVIPLVASAAGLLLAALLVLAVQALITYHRGSARALRIAD